MKFGLDGTLTFLLYFHSEFDAKNFREREKFYVLKFSNLQKTIYIKMSYCSFLPPRLVKNLCVRIKWKNC